MELFSSQLQNQNVNSIEQLSLFSDRFQETVIEFHKLREIASQEIQQIRNSIRSESLKSILIQAESIEALLENIGSSILRLIEQQQVSQEDSGSKTLYTIVRILKLISQLLQKKRQIIEHYQKATELVLNDIKKEVRLFRSNIDNKILSECEVIDEKLNQYLTQARTIIQKIQSQSQPIIQYTLSQDNRIIDWFNELKKQSQEGSKSSNSLTLRVEDITKSPFYLGGENEFNDQVELFNEWVLSVERYCKVYKAISKINKQPIAVKILIAESIRDYQEIIQYIYNIAKISAYKQTYCIHLLGLYIFNKSQQQNNKFTAILTMPLYKTDLQKNIRNQLYKKGSAQDVNLMLRHILQALEYLGTTQSIYHGNIKPENIFIADDGTYYLSGFSLMYDNKDKSCELRGTPTYEAPELIWGLQKDSKNDSKVFFQKCSLYSLGLCALQMYHLIGHLGFIRNIRNDYNNQQLYQLIQDIQEYHLRNLISGMLEVDPEKRLSLQQCLQLIADDTQNQSQARTSQEMNSIELVEHEQSSIWRDYKRQTIQIASADICFLMDCTGSMASRIKEIQQNLTQLVDSFKIFYKDSSYRIAFQGYKDFCDLQTKDGTIIEYPFKHFSQNAEEIQSLRNFIGSIKVDGGGDGPEDVNGGVKLAINNLSWSPQGSKFIIHVGDAPCHNKEYNGGYDSSEGHAKKALEEDEQWESLFQMAILQDIDYIFVKLNNTTDKMIERFKAIWAQILEQEDVKSLFTDLNKRVPSFKLIDFKSDGSNNFFGQIQKALLDKVKENVENGSILNNSLRLPISTQVQVSLKSSLLLTQEKFLEKLGLQTDIVNQNVNQEQFWKNLDNFPVTLEGTAYVIDCYQDSNGTGFLQRNFQLRVARNPFAAGAFNYAFAALDVEYNQRMVLKGCKDAVTRGYFYQEVKKNQISVSMANQFHKKLKQVSELSRLQFVSTLLFKVQEHYLVLEGFIPGEYKRYTNNYDYFTANKDIETRPLTAFSHYTYENSNHMYMVVDLQGVKRLLTDPVIHSFTGEFGDSGDLSVVGMNAFLSRHRCNEICRKLGLEENKFLLAEKAFEESVTPIRREMAREKCRNISCNDFKIPNQDWCVKCTINFQKAKKEDGQCIKCKKDIKGISKFVKIAFFVILCDTCRNEL